jgi:3-deoxy-manno-octulosonate cytidylyltransferase (CMP-KDO synthetase)
MAHKIIGIIPARFNSTRLPGKLLIPICGKTLLQRTYESAKKAQSLNHLVIATYEDCIHDHANTFGAAIVRTHANCANGTECLGAALERHPHLREADVIINIQGDMPFINLESIDLVAQALLADPLAQMSTIVTPLTTYEEAQNPSNVKCIIDNQQNALYFSRTLIPSNKSNTFNSKASYYRHIGLYAYRPSFVLKYLNLPATPLQLEEDLEQLRVLEHGYRIKVVIVNHTSIEVDLPEDIQKAEQWLCKQNTYL